MITYTVRELQEILRLHALYLKGDLNGIRADLSKANLSRANLLQADLSKANLSRANLLQADLSLANLSKADLSGANLSLANLSWANLSLANLSGADLSGADLSGADLSGANLSKADLSGADLSGANLSKADLSGANLSGANLSLADLSGADLSGADLNQTYFAETKTDIPIFTFNLGRHLGVYKEGIVTIGCQNHSLEHWLENIYEIGKEASYTDIEIKRYAAQLFLIKELESEKENFNK